MKSAVALICDKVGRKVVAERLGVGKTAVSNAATEGMFPARWYREIRLLCEEHGVECGDDLFNFVRCPDRQEEAPQMGGKKFPPASAA